MLTLVVRRALVQRRLVAAVLALVVVASTLLGVGALLLGPTQDRAFAVAVQRAPATDVDVTAFLLDVDGADLVETRDRAEGVVREVLGPLDPTVTSSATARMRRLGGTDRLGYLATGAALTDRAVLTSGRWPAERGGRRVEAVLPDAALDRLELAVGDRVSLGAEVGQGGVEAPVALEVVGTFRPLARAGWESDPLAGAGFEPAYSDGSVTAAAYGPFVVDDAAFLATGSTVSGLRVVAHPTLAHADDASLRAATAGLDDASALLSARVGDRTRITRVASELGRMLDRIHAQQATTRALVLVVLVLGTALALAALLLAGRLVAGVRDDERALLVALGLSRRQQLVAALAEAVVIAAVAALLAVPAAATVHAALTHLPALDDAGLAQAPTLTAALVLTVLAGALLLTLTLVATALDAAPTTAVSRRRTVARSGVDLVLVAIAVVAWWQLRAPPATTTARIDVTLTVAPVVCLAAVVAVTVRMVPLLLGLAARAGARSRSLVLPLAASQAARRPHTGVAMVLLAAAVAAASFGLALRATWERSQDDQAALRVGTDLSLTLPAAATAIEAAEVARATAAQDPVVSPVINRPLALGRYVGEPGSRPVLVAVDSRRAGALLRGRLDPGTTWAGIGAELAPGPPVAGVPLPTDGAGLTLRGRAPGDTALRVAPTAVVQDASGFRSSVAAADVPLDGRRHPVAWARPLGPGQRLVAVRYELDGTPDDAAVPGSTPNADVSLALQVPGRAEAEGWQVRALGRDTPVRAAEVARRPTGAGTVLRTVLRLDLGFFAYTGADVVTTAFVPPTEVPVAVSEALADAVGVRVGGELSALVGDAALPLRVVDMLPTVPSAPGQVAVLADADTLSRALVGAGRLDPVVDAWWVADPTPGTVRALEALDLGDVTTRQQVATDLARGPLRVTVPAALLTLVAAAALLLLAGVGLLLNADQRQRASEVARLRALGLSRGGARRLLLAEHAALVVPLVLLGAAVGLAAAASIGPRLIRSDVGAAPVPEAVVDWPWAGEALLVGGLLLAALLLAVVTTAHHVRRSDR